MDKEYLAKRLAEARRGARKPKVLGYNTKKKKCENCGKGNLSRTIEIQFPDGKISYFGSECANRLKSISYIPSRKKDLSEDVEEIEDNEELEEDLEEEEDSEEDSEQEEELEEVDELEDIEEEPESYLEKDSPDLYDPEYSGTLGTEYLADPLPTFEDKPSIENFDKRYQIKDVIFDSLKGKASIAHSADIRNVGFGAMMKPKTFLKLAVDFPGNKPENSSIKILEDSKKFPGWGPPILYIDIDNMQVTGHEGRHRNVLMNKWYPNENVLVHIIVRNKDFYIKKDLALEDIKRINKGLKKEGSDNLVSGKLFDYVFFDRKGVKYSGKV